MLNEMNEKTMIELAPLRPKAYTYLTDYDGERKKRVMKIKLTKKCLEATWLEIRINRIGKNKIDVNNLNPIQDGHFWGCSRMREAKRPLFLKSFTHALQ